MGLLQVRGIRFETNLLIPLTFFYILKTAIASVGKPCLRQSLNHCRDAYFQRFKPGKLLTSADWSWILKFMVDTCRPRQEDRFDSCGTVTVQAIAFRGEHWYAARLIE